MKGGMGKIRYIMYNVYLRESMERIITKEESMEAEKDKNKTRRKRKSDHVREREREQRK